MNLQHGLDLTEEKLSPTPFPLTLGYACDTTGMGGGGRGGGKGRNQVYGKKRERGKWELKKNTKKNKYDGSKKCISKLFDL